jgi:apolipoprotein N-acyltransferase
MLAKIKNNGALTDLAALLAGLGMPLAFAPYGLFPLAVILPAVLLVTWRSTTPGRAFRRGYLFGFGMFGFGVYWLHISINLFGGSNLLLALGATYLLVAFLALYPALVGWFLRRYFAHKEALALLIVAPALWVLAEWIRGWLLSGFPWLSLGYSQIDSWLGGFAPVLGVFGVSWIIMLLAGLLIFAGYAHNHVRRATTIMVIGLILVTGVVLKNTDWSRPTGMVLSVAMVQGSIEQAIKWEPAQLQQTMDLYHNLTQPYWGKVDMIIWPETAIPAFDVQIRDYLDTQRGYALQSDTMLILGLATIDKSTRDYFNSLIAVGPHEDVYHKRHLVPFGEYLPLKKLLDPVLAFLEIPMSDFSPGNAKKPLLEMDDFQIGVSICYEDVFGEEVIEALPEADLLINVSNDAWFGDSIAPHQHLEIARMRSLETGRYMIRATNTGISAIIDNKGEIRSRLPQFQTRVLEAEVALYQGVSPYARVGNYAIVLIASFCLLFSIIFVRRA